MGLILLILSMTLTSVLFFSSKTEQSRIVTIQRPLVITQERKSPAFYVFRQLQNLKKIETEKTKQETNQATIFLSNLNRSSAIQDGFLRADSRIYVAEMNLSKKEFSAILDSPSNLNNPTVGLTKSLQTSTDHPELESIVRIDEKIDYPQKQTAIQIPIGKRTTIKGKLELINGVGIVDHYVELKRIEEGTVREIGRIDLKEGLYSIDIESTRGYLVAQIKDQKGLLIGEDRENLANLQNHGSFYEGPFLRIGPPNEIASNPKLPVTKAVTQSLTVSLFDNESILEKPQDKFTNISRYSSTISRVFDPSRIYKNITSIRFSGEKNETSMFTTKWIEGIISYISDMKKIEFKSKSAPIIIGRMLSNGRPVSNIEVQIETDPSLEPIYLDQFMIPSFNQKGTSENGYFMFVGLEPGNYHVVALDQNQPIGSQLFIVEEESIAFQNISTTRESRFKVLRSYDAFSAESVDADIILSDVEEVITTRSGVTSFKINSEYSIAEYLVRSNNSQYIPFRYTQNSNEDYAHIPMIQKDWIENIKKFALISIMQNTGTIIGFTQDLDYEVYLLFENYNKNNIIYFNQLGQITTHPTKGGGFVLFNVPAGAREVVLQEKNTDKIYSQVFQVNVDQTSVSHFRAD